MTSVLVVHESYAEPGGEDTAYQADLTALRTNGHQVTTWNVQNSEIASWTRLHQATLFLRTTWSQSSYRHLQHLVRAGRPDVVHFHNTLPLISPGAVHAAHHMAVPVVMTMHNYRLLCPTGLFYREGRVCEDCVGSLVHGVRHGCYRGSRVQTAAVAMMLTVHRLLRTWQRCVDAYIVMTEFMKSSLERAGLPGDRIHLRPHFMPRPHAIGTTDKERYLVFIGRLSGEKGISTLLDAAARFHAPVRIIGTGPMSPLVQEHAARHPAQLQAIGHVPHEKALALLSGAIALVFPSDCYESFPLVVVEAFALGVPVIASDLGGRSESVHDSVNGVLFNPGDAAALADRVNRLLADREMRARMSAAARKTYENDLAPEISYRRLMEIYGMAQASAASRRAAA